MEWRFAEFGCALREQGCCEATVENYRFQMGRFAKWIGERELTTTTLGEWWLYQIDHYHRSGSIGRRNVVGRYLQWRLDNAEDSGGDMTPWVALLGKLKRLKAPREHREKRAISWESLQLLLAAPDINTPDGLRDRAGLELFCLGLRIGEIVGLKAADVSLLDSTISVIGKRNKQRHVMIPDMSLDILGLYLSRRPWDPRDESLLRIRGERIRCLVKHYAAQVGLGDIKPHDLRAAFISLMLGRGAPESGVQKLVGHEDHRMVHYYATLGQELADATMVRYHPRSSVAVEGGGP
jgi:integrase/recombinase XerD